MVIRKDPAGKNSFIRSVSFEQHHPQNRQHPHFGPDIKRLKDFTPDTWRYRIGAWRFFYEIDEEEKVTSMVAASHRSNAYLFFNNLPRRFGKSYGVFTCPLVPQAASPCLAGERACNGRRVCVQKNCPVYLMDPVQKIYLNRIHSIFAFSARSARTSPKMHLSPKRKHYFQTLLLGLG